MQKLITLAHYGLDRLSGVGRDRPDKEVNEMLSPLPDLHKKVRVAFDWTRYLIFPKDVCAVHDLSYRRDFHRLESLKEAAGSKGITNQVPVEPSS